MAVGTLVVLSLDAFVMIDHEWNSISYQLKLVRPCRSNWPMQQQYTDQIIWYGNRNINNAAMGELRASNKPRQAVTFIGTHGAQNCIFLLLVWLFKSFIDSKH